MHSSDSAPSSTAHRLLITAALLGAPLLPAWGAPAAGGDPRVPGPPGEPAPVPAPAADGWVELFDGASLTGWTPVGGPYDGHAAWSVEDGVIVGREGENHAGGLLYTEALYGDHEFECDAWVSFPFDSGIFVRMLTGERGVQATLDYRDGGEIGGIYSNGYLFHNTEAKAKWRRDEWNHVRVRCVGNPPHLVVWLNGELVTDFQVPEGLGTFAPKGRVGIQVHGDRADPAGSKVMFKNLRVRELPDGAGTYFVRDAAGHMALTEHMAHTGHMARTGHMGRMAGAVAVRCWPRQWR